MILGERYKSRKDFWMLILDSNEETLLRVTFSKSICNVLFKLFDVGNIGNMNFYRREVELIL